MTETPTDPSVAVVCQFKALNDDITDADSRAQAALLLRERLEEQGYALATDPVPADPYPVTLNADYTGWRRFEPGTGALDGHVIEWTATGSPIVTDPDPLIGGVVVDGAYSVAVPVDVTAAGGPVRVRHGLGGPVTVRVRGAEDKPMGYLFTQPITDAEEHVELVPGAVTIHVTLDPEEEADA